MLKRSSRKASQLNDPRLRGGSDRPACHTNRGHRSGEEEVGREGLSRRGRESAVRLNPFPLSEVFSMTSTSVSVAAAAAAPLSVVSSSVTKAGAIARAAHDLLLHLERGQRIDAPVLHTAMENAFGASDADGGWD